MMVKSRLVSRSLWFPILLLLASCVRIGSNVGPMSQFPLQEGSRQQMLVPQRLWTLALDYQFTAQAASDSSGLLTMESTLTLLDSGVKRVLIRIVFVGTENEVLGNTTLLDVNSFRTNPILTNHQLRTPAGTVAVAFESTTRGGVPFSDD